jgi:plastocyanin
MKRTHYVKGGILLGAIVLLGSGCPAQPVKTTPSPTADVSPANDFAVSPEPAAGTVDEPAASGDTAQNAVEVVITATGFSPATVTVAPGMTVTFVNTDTKGHQVASSPHPVHTGLPGFDSRTPIPPGGKYSFTFMQAGTFGYHDHLAPEMRGTVTVK